MVQISFMGLWLVSNLNCWKFYATAWEVREGPVSNESALAVQPIIGVS